MSRRKFRFGSTQSRGERADQVAQDRRLAEDRRGAQSAHGGGGMMILRAALTVVLGMASVSSAQDVPNFDGTHSGTWQVSTYSGAVTLTIKQKGTKVSGDIDLKGARNFSYDTVTGNISNGVLHFSSGQLSGDLSITDAGISGPFCHSMCGQMNFPKKQ
jgi:hypothetical protein